MAKTNITVRDAGEVLEHRQARRGVTAINRSLGVSHPSIRKYKPIVETTASK